MIRSLHIKNYALIDSLDLDLDPGFNIITGETGAGKSIILGALSLLLGARADLKAVRNPEMKSVIEADFDLSRSPRVRELLAAADLTGDDSASVLLRRELLPGGRSRAFVNDTPATLATLRDISLRLVDIHSQHQNLLLADPAFQLDVVDTLAGNAALLDEYRSAYADFRRALRKFTDTRESVRRTQADREFIAFQYAQLAEAELVPGETEGLEAERSLQADAGEIRSRMLAASGPLAENPEANAADLLGDASAALCALAANFADTTADTDWHALAERLESARLEVADIAATVARAEARLEADPGRLEEIEQRLSLLYSLQTKHHAENTDALIAIRDRLAEQLATLADSEGILAKLQADARRAKKKAAELAGRLSGARSTAAAAFAADLRNSASTLGMPNLRCEINITRGKLTPTGADQIQFLFAFNKNQTLTPVGATASGGEISRLMLSLKSILAARMSLPTIIFDEVDTGVSGDIAARMAAMMAHISRDIQVLTITHLPGVAAMGARHFKVFKQDDDTATTTRVQRLDGAGREAELALMLGGDPAEESALATARTLLQKASDTSK